MLAESDPAANFGRGNACAPQFAQSGGVGRFRELLPGGIANEAVMSIDGLRQPEKRLQKPMDACRPEQVLAAHNLRDTL